MKRTDETLKAARTKLHKERWDGVACPCCDQWVHVNRRHLYATQMQALIRLFHYSKLMGGKPWVHFSDFLKEWKDTSSRGGDPMKMVRWGLIARAEGKRKDGSSRVGFYRITSLGKNFVLGQAKVPAFLYFYNDHLLAPARGRTKAPLVTIHEVLARKKKFDYKELMSTSERKVASLATHVSWSPG